MTQAGLLVPPWPTNLVQAQQTIEEGHVNEWCSLTAQPVCCVWKVRVRSSLQYFHLRDYLVGRLPKENFIQRASQGCLYLTLGVTREYVSNMN